MVCRVAILPSLQIYCYVYGVTIDGFKQIYWKLKTQQLRVTITSWIYNPLFLPASLGSGVYTASNRHEYQKHKNNNVSGK
jgi:hypothetical protein